MVLESRIFVCNGINIHLILYGWSLVVKAKLENMAFRLHDQWPVIEKKFNTTGRAQGCWPGTKRDARLVFAFSVLV